MDFQWKALVTSIILAGLIVGCGSSPPSCSDEKTLDIVKYLAYGEFFTLEELKGHIEFVNPMATAQNKDIKQISCRASMIVAQLQDIPVQVEYVTQLDDNNEHVVTLKRLSAGNPLFNQAVIFKLQKVIKGSKKEEKVNPEPSTVSSASVPTPESKVAEPSNSLEVIIPLQFHGYWGSQESCKVWTENPDARMGAPSPGLQVNAASINYIEGGCSLATVKTANDSNFTGAFRCTGDDGTVDTKLTEMSLKLEGDKLRHLEDSFTKCH